MWYLGISALVRVFPLVPQISLFFLSENFLGEWEGRGRRKRQRLKSAFLGYLTLSVNVSYKSLIKLYQYGFHYVAFSLGKGRRLDVFALYKPCYMRETVFLAIRTKGQLVCLDTCQSNELVQTGPSSNDKALPSMKQTKMPVLTNTEVVNALAACSINILPVVSVKIRGTSC